MFNVISGKTNNGTITISGINELANRLSIFSDKMANQIVLVAARAATQPFLNKALDNVDLNNYNIKNHLLKISGKYELLTPGNLKKNIKIKRNKNVEKGSVRFEVFVNKKRAWYAQFIEHGKSNFAATPFLATAFESELENAKSIFKARIIQALNEGGI